MNEQTYEDFSKSLNSLLNGISFDTKELDTILERNKALETELVKLENKKIPAPVTISQNLIDNTSDNADNIEAKTLFISTLAHKILRDLMNSINQKIANKADDKSKRQLNEKEQDRLINQLISTSTALLQETPYATLKDQNENLTKAVRENIETRYFSENNFFRSHPTEKNKGGVKTTRARRNTFLGFSDYVIITRNLDFRILAGIKKIFPAFEPPSDFVFSELNQLSQEEDTALIEKKNN